MRPIRHLYQNRELLLIWAWREIRVRYKQSVLGVAWAVLQPAAMMIVLTLVFSLVLNLPTGDIPYPLFSYVAVLPWTFLSTSIATGVPSLVSNMNLVTKVKMPREVIPVGSVLASAVDFAVASLLFGGLLLAYRVNLKPVVLWTVPLLVIQVALTLAVVLAGSALNVLYRDIRFVVPLATQLWMYATPIIYPAEMVPSRLRWIVYVNPMAPVIDGYRRVVLKGLPPDLSATSTAAMVSLAFLISSYWLFKHLEPRFADLI